MISLRPLLHSLAGIFGRRRRSEASDDDETIVRNRNNYSGTFKYMDPPAATGPGPLTVLCRPPKENHGAFDSNSRQGKPTRQLHRSRTLVNRILEVCVEATQHYLAVGAKGTWTPPHPPNPPDDGAQWLFRANINTICGVLWHDCRNLYDTGNQVWRVLGWAKTLTTSDVTDEKAMDAAIHLCQFLGAEEWVMRLEDVQGRRFWRYASRFINRSMWVPLKSWIKKLRASPVRSV